MRWIDRFGGVPLCAAATAVRGCVEAVAPPPAPAAPSRVLIVNLAEMGATVLALPALAELHRRAPRAQLHFLVFPGTASVVETLGLASPERLHLVDPSDPGRLAASCLRALGGLRRARIDTVLDLEFFSRFSALMGYLACPRGVRAGFHPFHAPGVYRGDLLTHRVVYSPLQHASRSFMALVRSLFEEPDSDPYYRGAVASEDLRLPSTRPSEEALRAAGQLLAEAGVPAREGSLLLLVNPNAAEAIPQRRWPLENFGQLCIRLLEENPQARLAITGAPSDVGIAGALAERIGCSRVADLSGRTTFPVLLALQSMADLLVTNDSGPAHFASLVGLPTVALFGPESPAVFGPLGERCLSLHADFACSPCVTVYNAKRSPCGDNRCLQALSVERVLAAARSLLGARTGALRSP